MSDEIGKSIYGYIVDGMVTLLSGLWLYHQKKISDMPEKYLSKSDFAEAKKEIREDIKQVKDSLETTAKGIHDRLDKLFESKL